MNVKEFKHKLIDDLSNFEDKNNEMKYNHRNDEVNYDYFFVEFMNYLKHKDKIRS